MTKKKKVKPAPKKIKMEIEFTLDDLDSEKYETPKALEIWSKDESVSKEYKELFGELVNLIHYISIKLNNGPEVKDSVVKRTILLKSLLSQLVYETWLNGYFRYGVVTELLYDLYMDTSGRSKVLMTIRDVEIYKAKQSKKKSGSYVA